MEWKRRWPGIKSMGISNILSSISIKSLYPLALAEGEGVGTAYEYYAKRLVLGPLLARMAPPKQILLAGLPEKYGASLDFLLLAAELGADLLIVDDRPEALEKSENALANAQRIGLLEGVTPTYRLVDLADLVLSEPFDLALSCEVLQRLPAGARRPYWETLWRLAPAVALFAPNGDNPAHTNLSGLAGLYLHQLRALIGDSGRTGYIDMPPFPPGMTRSDEQREQATSGRFEAAAMWGLNFYARTEKFLPAALRRRQSHIVYATAFRSKVLVQKQLGFCDRSTRESPFKTESYSLTSAKRE